MSKIFFTSDLHFSHKNIAKFCPQFRPFDNIADMDEYLIEKEYCDSRFLNVYDHLIGASYADVVIDNLKKIEDDLAIPESNSIILVYNYKYCGQVKEQPNIKFIATVNYR